MSRDSYIRVLNYSLRVFFRDAVRISLKRPSHALQFIKTVRWQKQAAKRRSRWAREEGIHVPPIIIFSVTNICNLQCKGCYAKALNRSSEDELDDGQLERIVEEAHELGSSFFVLAGGEPLVRKNILDVTRRFPDIIFLIFTNGLLIDDDMLDVLKTQRHVVPVISLEGHEAETDDRRGEGVFERLQKTVKRIHAEGLFFSVSVTVTRSNLPVVTNADFIEGLIDSGCRLFFFLEYTAIHEGTEAWMPTEEERENLNRIVAGYREKFPALFISIPGDEEKFGGCLSAGRGFIHITADGDLEPCPFAPFSDINVKNMSLKEGLRSRLLKVIRENADKLEEGQGGCTLWQQRDWVESLLEQTNQEVTPE
jgi:MoaA/NifB/PqqE/SkfB family radical SAM enzyme